MITPAARPTKILNRIIYVRAQRVMLDSDLAILYGVSTKRLNEQVKRNRNRFPRDFMFRLSWRERNEVVANCDHLELIKFSHVRPLVFTEHGAVMLASVLISPKAVRVSIQVVRAFNQIRKILLSNLELAKKIQALEKNYDAHFRVVFEAIRELMTEAEKPKRRIGFHQAGE